MGFDAEQKNGQNPFQLRIADFRNERIHEKSVTPL